MVTLPRRGSLIPPKSRYSAPGEDPHNPAALPPADPTRPTPATLHLPLTPALQLTHHGMSRTTATPGKGSPLITALASKAIQTRDTKSQSQNKHPRVLPIPHLNRSPRAGPMFPDSHRSQAWSWRHRTSRVTSCANLAFHQHQSPGPPHSTRPRHWYQNLPAAQSHYASSSTQRPPLAGGPWPGWLLDHPREGQHQVPVPMFFHDSSCDLHQNAMGGYYWTVWPAKASWLVNGWGESPEARPWRPSAPPTPPKPAPPAPQTPRTHSVRL